MRALVALALVAACGGRPSPPATAVAPPAEPASLADQIIALLPQGAQVVVELDLARLRANPVVGGMVTRAVADGVLDSLPGEVSASPLALADLVVLAAYGVGTEQAATVTVLAVHDPATPEAGARAPAAERARALAAIEGAVRLSDYIFALGPTEWTAQLEHRAVLTLGDTVVAAPAELLALRDHAMPENAPGASLRITARLPADARATLMQQVGVRGAPARLSVWADVVDDFVMIVDAEVDAKGKAAARPAARLEAMIRGALGTLAREPAARMLGLPASLSRAKLVAEGPWVRTIIEIGPSYLQRVVARATELLEARPAPAAPAAPAPTTGGPSS